MCPLQVLQPTPLPQVRSSQYEHTLLSAFYCVLLHRFDLLSKVASKYAASVTERLSKLDRMERDLNTTALSLAVSVDEVNNNARKVQERLERHCNGT